MGRWFEHWGFAAKVGLFGDRTGRPDVQANVSSGKKKSSVAIEHWACVSGRKWRTSGYDAGTDEPSGAGAWHSTLNADKSNCSGICQRTVKSPTPCIQRNKRRTFSGLSEKRAHSDATKETTSSSWTTRSHHVKGGGRSVRNGHDSLYLPPYSPDLNPIEMLWSVREAILLSFDCTFNR